MIPAEIRLSLTFFIGGYFLLFFFSCNYTIPNFTEAPQMRANPNSAAPLVTYLDLKASEPVRVLVEIYDGAQQRWEYRPGGVFKQKHHIPIFQLKPSSDYEFKITLVDTWGNRSKKPPIIKYRTADLPSDFPPLDLVKAQTDKREPGFHLLSILKTNDGVVDQNRGFLAAVSRRGEVYWFFEDDRALETIELCGSGHILCSNKEGYILEIDFLGNIIEKIGEKNCRYQKTNWLVSDSSNWSKPELALFLKASADAYWPENISALHFTGSAAFFMMEEQTAENHLGKITEYREEGESALRQNWVYGKSPGEYFGLSPRASLEQVDRSKNVLIHARSASGKEMLREVTYGPEAKTVFELQLSGPYIISDVKHLSKLK